jgi:hypothetical protein
MLSLKKKMFFCGKHQIKKNQAINKTSHPQLKSVG